LVAPQSTPLRSALGLLLQAWEYAEDCERDAWDFAVEIHSLRQHGLTNSAPALAFV
jgi:hypothetical protein